MKGTYVIFISCIVMCYSCKPENKQQPVIKPVIESTTQLVTTDSSPVNRPKTNTDPTTINTGTTTPAQLLHYARALQGIPYKYASAIPDSGFDCSGFITYIFNHFGITVPRSSASFTHIQTAIPLAAALPGDLILFTGTDTAIHTVGHMGIIESVANDTIYFIHASSGKANGVTISPLEAYYKSRFVKIIRVFPNGIVANVGGRHRLSATFKIFEIQSDTVLYCHVMKNTSLSNLFNNIIKDGIPKKSGQAARTGK